MATVFPTAARAKPEAAAETEVNFKNQTIFTGDNLHILRGLNSDSVDLIYLDPPFNSKKQWNAPIGSKAAGAAFKDTWTLSDVDLAWHDELRIKNPALYDVILAARGAGGDPTMSYLLMMSVRLMEMKRVLKPTGSIYLHCDPTESHSLKLMMDTIFGRDRFLNEIIWSYRRWAGKARRYQRMHDVVLFYSNGDGQVWNWPMEPKAGGTPKYKRWNEIDPTTGKMVTRSDKSVVVSETNMRDVWEIGRLQSTAKERVGYPTQKPLALLERIILASSNEGDVVLDPFCGCATAAIAAEKLNRQWIGIDISKMAIHLVKERLRNDLGLMSSTAIHRTDIPLRTDLGDLPHYRTHKDTLYGWQGGHCKGCGGHFTKPNMDVDHIIPRKDGGTDHIENLQCLCSGCNRLKGSQPMSYLAARLLKERGIQYGGRVEEMFLAAQEEVGSMSDLDAAAWRKHRVAAEEQQRAAAEAYRRRTEGRRAWLMTEGEVEGMAE